MDQTSRFRAASEGARKVLAECLGLSAGDVLALFWDETTQMPHDVLKQAADELGIAVCGREVLLQEQALFTPSLGLSLADYDALSNARGILTCLSGHTAGMAYRSELLRVGVNAHVRFGHMPGINLSVLANAVNIDYEQATARCDNLALALTLGQQVRLQTYLFDADGAVQEEFDLYFEIGGLLRSPITSTGIIPAGTWGNLPGGETFIAPMENTAQGTFVLNGAFKNYVLPPTAALLLRFQDGYLQPEIEGDELACGKFEEILDFARRQHDPNYGSLAELGIGVNPGIQGLTGNALFDEKCFGTAHIAVGDSQRYGGEHASQIHEDLVALSPSIWVDDKPLLFRGQDAFRAEDWRESLDETIAAPFLQDAAVKIRRTAINVERGMNGTLRVRREVAAGRIGTYTVAEPQTSQLLRQIYEMTPRLATQEISLYELTAQSQRTLAVAPAQVAAALTILVKHGLINIPDEM